MTKSIAKKSTTGSLPPAVPLAITPTVSPWTHTSDDSYIYQLSLVLATATVSCVHNSYITRSVRLNLSIWKSFECSIVFVRSLPLVFRTTMRRNSYVLFFHFLFGHTLFSRTLLFCLVRCISGDDRHLLVFFFTFLFLLA